jgi:hypothetical protein
MIQFEFFRYPNLITPGRRYVKKLAEKQPRLPVRDPAVRSIDQPCRTC